jgi:K+-transporting ATPase KdpF subunit
LDALITSTASWVGAKANRMEILAAVVSGFLLIYLTYAMLYAERF